MKSRSYYLYMRLHDVYMILDAFADYGTIGVLVRLGDKIRRLQSISKTGITMVEDEKIQQ